MLPENFYLYKDKDPCPGCRGCKDDHDTKPNVSDDIVQSIISNSKNPVASANKPIDLTPDLKASVEESLQLSEKEASSDKDVTKQEKVFYRNLNSFRLIHKALYLRRQF